MAIDPRQLSPWAQKQIAEKMAKNLREKAVKADKDETEAKTRKYHNVPTEKAGEDGAKLHFDSKKEAEYFDQLMLRLKANRIRDLKLQPQFTLQEAYTLPNGNRVRAIRYQADFSYYDCDLDKDVVVDVKSKATKTRVYAIKKKLLLEKFEIEITEV